MRYNEIAINEERGSKGYWAKTVTLPVPIRLKDEWQGLLKKLGLDALVLTDEMVSDLETTIVTVPCPTEKIALKLTAMWEAIILSTARAA